MEEKINGIKNICREYLSLVEMRLKEKEYRSGEKEFDKALFYRDIGRLDVIRDLNIMEDKDIDELKERIYYQFTS